MYILNNWTNKKKKKIVQLGLYHNCSLISFCGISRLTDKLQFTSHTIIVSSILCKKSIDIGILGNHKYTKRGNKNFSFSTNYFLFTWIYASISSQHSLLSLMHLFPRYFHFWKHPWKSSEIRSFNTDVTARLISFKLS